VGRLAPEKNIPVVIEAYRAMRRVNGALRGVLVGDGPLRAALQSPHPDLHFAGMRVGEDLAAHYASADVFLFPSETETFGNVTVEALASGLAVVAYDYAAARQCITSGETGMLVPRGRPGEFVERAAALARAPDTVARLRRGARAAVGELDWPQVVARFEAVLAGTHEGRAGRGPASGTHVTSAITADVAGTPV
jgi:glycosyltransferase involved in cell wall biosynthesis